MSYNKEYQKIYQKKNKEKLALKNKLWRKNNPYKVKKAHQKQIDSGYTKKYQIKYRQTLACKYSSLKGRAKQRKIPFDLDKDIFIKWLKTHKRKCCYCNAKVTMGTTGKRKSWLTIDRINNDVGYEIQNIVVSCYRCNILKSDDIPYGLMRQIGRCIQIYKEKYNKTWNGEDWVNDA